MSVVERTKTAVEDVDTASLRAQLVGYVFGDRRGLAVFLGSVCALFVFTRVGIFITDTLTTANAFVALTDGHFAVTEPFYGDSLDTPGMFVVDGNHYGRGYGLLVGSLPTYWLLRGASAVADLRIALVGLWSLCLLALSMTLGRLFDHRRLFAVGGSAVALLLFVLNVALATPLSEKMLPILAMQLTSILAGALLAVVVYRLVRYLLTARIGVVASVLVLFATPVAFWAPIPKRHVATTLLAFVAFLAFARSRSDEEPRRILLHAGAYAAVALVAWVHAPEAAVLLFTLLIADIVSSPLKRIRAVPVIAGVFIVSLLPFFLTNLFVTGNPVVPPRVEGGLVDVPTQNGGSGGGSGSDSSTSGDQPFRLPYVGENVSLVLAFINQLKHGLVTAWYHPEQVSQTFLRSGYIVNKESAINEAINLSVLESAPILGAVVAPLSRVFDGRPAARSLVTRLRQPGGATAFALGLYAVLFSLLYLPRLPIHAQVTVRYLLPVYVVGVISVVWCGPFQRALKQHTSTFVWSTAMSILIGGQLLVVALVGLDLALGESFQFHALLGLALAGALAIVSVLTVVTDRADRLLAATLGVTTAAVTVFTLLIVTAHASSIGFYPNGGDQLLPIMRVLADLLEPL